LFWYNNLLDKSFKTWQAIHNAFIKRWEIKKYGRFILTQFSQMKRKEIESIDEFYEILYFDESVSLGPYAKGWSDSVLF
jgi:hypothetical protein